MTATKAKGDPEVRIRSPCARLLSVAYQLQPEILLDFYLSALIFAGAAEWRRVPAPGSEVGISAPLYRLHWRRETVGFSLSPVFCVATAGQVGISFTIRLLAGSALHAPRKIVKTSRVNPT